MNDHRTAHENYESHDESRAPHILRTSKQAKGKRPIAIVEVKPHESTRVSLGMFDTHAPPKGFMLGIDPDPVSENSLTSDVVNLTKEKSHQYELMLFLENFGAKTVSVEIWEI